MGMGGCLKKCKKDGNIWVVRVFLISEKSADKRNKDLKRIVDQLNFWWFRFWGRRTRSLERKWEKMTCFVREWLA